MLHPFLLRKIAFVDPSMMQGAAGGGAPMQGAMPPGGGMPQGMPMDPSMMGGGMPQGMSMDPSMMGGAPGQPSPSDVAAAMQGGGGGTGGLDVETLKQVIREVLEESGVKKKGGDKEELNAKLDEILQSLRMLLNVQGLGGVIPQTPTSAPQEAPASGGAAMMGGGPSLPPELAGMGGGAPVEQKMASDNVQQFFNKVEALQRAFQKLR